MFIEPNWDGNGVIKDSRRIETFFQRGGLAQRYLLKMKFIDNNAKEDYLEHLLYGRRRAQRTGYDRKGARILEYYEKTGLVPQIKDIFRKVLIEELEQKIGKKLADIRDPFIRKRILANYKELSKLDMKFNEYCNLLRYGIVDEIPITIFGYNGRQDNKVL